MSFIRSLTDVIAFLTIIPVHKREVHLEEIAANMYLFPLIGAGLGLCIGIFTKALMILLPSSFISSVLTVGALYLITGLHHFDGLLDFGDGVMMKGTPNERISAMRDNITGAGGFGLGIINTLLLISCLLAIPTGNVVAFLVTAETSAKLAMVLGVIFGKPSVDGVGSIFIRILKGRRAKFTLLISLAFSVAIAILTLGIRGLLGLFSAFVITWILVELSHRIFRFVTGDVLGAMNELTRSFSLLVLVALSWL